MTFVKRVLSAGLATALLSTAISPVAFATPQDDLAAASEQLEALGAELAQLQDNLETKTSELEMTAYEIGEKEAQISSTSRKLVRARRVLARRMRSSYKSGPTTIVEVLLSSASLDDLVSRIYYMDKVSAEDVASIETVRTLEDRLNQEKELLSSKKEEQSAAVEAVRGEVQNYEEKVAEAQAYYDQLDAEVQAQLAAQAAAEQEARRAAAVAMEAIREAPVVADASTTALPPATDTGNAGTSPVSERPAQEPNSSDSGSNSGSTSSYGGAGVASAYSCIGKPYVYGAAGPNGFDCSGLVCYCYGYARGRTTYQMIASLQASGRWKTSMSQLNYGDLVFPHSGHVGIYIGDGMMIHAPTPGRTVCIAAVYAFYGGGTY